jgi:excisionase family DNA binding protein
MTRGDTRPAVEEILNELADLLSERYFDRIGDRLRKIPELRRLITAKEAGQYLSLSTDTLYRMASQKKIPYLKIGDRVLFDLKALDEWIEKVIVQDKGWKKQELKPQAVPDGGEEGQDPKLFPLPEDA